MEEGKRLAILELLQGNARLSAAQIAVMVGETEAAVVDTVRQLEEQRIILRHTALVDWDRAGTDRVTATIDVKLHPQRGAGFDRLAQRIARFPEVRSCYLMSGAYDLAVLVESSSLKEVARFVSERLSTLEGVASTTTHFVLKRYKHDGITFFDDERNDERLAVHP
ncbi:MAG TPA: Lrp/AsnC family transcriptional regulator [Symbiobacteriaceae bacterium]|nr:Lrp/AsnC family transcriptional regulator [Symbiobacteriaceae bacterium]